MLISDLKYFSWNSTCCIISSFVNETSSGTTMEQSLNNVNLCATGYKATGGNVVSDTCSSMSLSGLSKRYCQKTYQFTCVKGTTPSVPAATLS